MGDHLYGDKDLKQAAKLVRESMLESLSDPTEGEYSYSESFLQRIDKLIEYDKWRNRRQKTIRHVAAFFIAVLVSVTSWLSVDVHAREAVFGWVKNVYEHFVEYAFSGNEMKTEIPQYELSYIPSGFDLVETTIYEGFYSAFYLKPETGDTIVFECLQSTKETTLQIFDPEEDVSSETVEVCGTQAELFSFETKGSRTLVWADSKANTLFKIDSNLSAECIIDIAENLKLVDFTK